MDFPRIPKSLKEKPFRLKKAVAAGVSRHRLNQLVSSGIIEKIAWGVYRCTEHDLSEEDFFIAATTKTGTPSAICLLSALSYYDFTDEIPTETWVMVPASKVLHAKNIKLLRVSNPKWSIGIIKHPGFRITSIERTLIECLIYKRQLGSRIGIDAIKLALERNKTTLRKIYETAKSLGVTHRIKSYIEVLS